MRHRIAAVLAAVAFAIFAGVEAAEFVTASDVMPYASPGVQGPAFDRGKWELVPIFKHGRPVIVSGHQYYAQRNTYRLTLADGNAVTVFGGETTDLASIPKAVWPILPPDGAYGKAAGVHDQCYKSRGTFEFRGKAGSVQVGRTRAAPYDRAGCDDILRQGMVALGVSTLQRVIIYEAVRVGGGGGWGH